MIVERKTYLYVNTMAFRRQPFRAFSPNAAFRKVERQRVFMSLNEEFLILRLEIGCFQTYIRLYATHEDFPRFRI